MKDYNENVPKNYKQGKKDRELRAISLYLSIVKRRLYDKLDDTKWINKLLYSKKEEYKIYIEQISIVKNNIFADLIINNIEINKTDKIKIKNKNQAYFLGTLKRISRDLGDFFESVSEFEIPDGVIYSMNFKPNDINTVNIIEVKKEDETENVRDYKAKVEDYEDEYQTRERENSKLESMRMNALSELFNTFSKNPTEFRNKYLSGYFRKLVLDVEGGYSVRDFIKNIINNNIPIKKMLQKSEIPYRIDITIEKLDDTLRRREEEFIINMTKEQKKREDDAAESVRQEKIRAQREMELEKYEICKEKAEKALKEEKELEVFRDKIRQRRDALIAEGETQKLKDIEEMMRDGQKLNEEFKLEQRVKEEKEYRISESNKLIKEKEAIVRKGLNDEIKEKLRVLYNRIEEERSTERMHLRFSVPGSKRAERLTRESAARDVIRNREINDLKNLLQ